MKLFIIDTAWRTVSTACETALALVGTNAVGITDVDWIGMASAVALASVVTILKCIAVEAKKHEVEE